ncbi:MAG: metallophosphoesterase [Eubacterium sp.]|nr:metallophosphoesterase [Eubacterium sp.]
MSKRNTKMKKVTAWILMCVMLLGVCPVQQVQAASATGTTTLRILSTTDLHGQSVNINYDSAYEYKKGSLAQAATLINEAKASLKYGNTLLVDIGDTIYGYGSDSIYRGSVTGGEYMYAEMAQMGYDAMTVGNHDFDYGYMYLKDQLEEAGLGSKVIVSNVYDAQSKKNIWAENKVITKKLKTTTGKTISVKIGLIGVTTPTLTTHYDHSLLLTTKDMVDSVEEQVEKLKTKNVDLIIALAHTGIGSDGEYVQMSENAAYELSKIDGLDAIVGGHAHVNFPSSDANVQKFYNYSGVSADGLLNGKPYVAVKDHGAGVGMIDLKLKLVNGKVQVAGSNTKIKYVKTSTKPDPTVTEINDQYQEQFDEIYNTSLAKVNGRVTNYFGPLEDNVAVQLANEAKIHYGLEYINNVATDFKDCPVVAVTSYNLTGNQSAQDYIDVEGDFTVADALNIQNWNKEFAFIYSITGDQLREWLEWVASAYQKPSAAMNSDWKDSVVQQHVEDENLVPVLNKDWLDDWSGFLVFDGVEYEIDPTKSARYNKDGDLINENAHRVTKFTCNGKEVTDDMEFVLVSPRLNSSFCKVATSISEYVICNKRVYINELLQDYLKEQSQYSEVNVQTDENWEVIFPEGTNYLIKSSKKSEDYARTADWYIQTLDKNSKSAYYQAAVKEEKEDQAPPFLVLASGNTKVTNHKVPIVVQASDRSGVRTVKYYNGIAPADSALWNGASVVAGGSFAVSSNGVYSVMAEDKCGNRTVKYIQVANYDEGMLETPEITKCTNRAKQVLGKAEPGTTVYVVAEGETYSAVVQEDGSFAVSTPKLPADSVIKLWIEDASGRKSIEISCAVKRTGANTPEVDEITNKSQVITGVLNDSKYCKVIAFAGDVVYVPEDGGLQAYENSPVYDYKKKVELVEYSVSDGMFHLSIPAPLAGTKLQVYSLDWTDKSSVVTSMVATDVAPNMPRLNQIYAVDDCIYGKIPAPKNGPYRIEVTGGAETYTGVSDASGFFAIAVGDLPEGKQLVVTASDTVDGMERTSAQAQVTVAPVSEIPISYSDISFDEIDSKSTIVSGHMKDYEGPINLLIGNTRVKTMVNSGGSFSYTMSQPKAPGTLITAMVRDTDGSIWDVNQTTVKLALPETPELITDVIYDTTEEIELFCIDQATAVVKIGKKYYKNDQGVYDEELGGYVYTVKVTKKAAADDAVIIYMMNETGKSGKLNTVVEADPEAEPETQTEKEKN